MGYYSHNILHQFYRFCKNLPVHPLEDHLHLPHIADLKGQQISIINMSAPEGLAFCKPSCKFKICDCFPDLKF